MWWAKTSIEMYWWLPRVMTTQRFLPVSSRPRIFFGSMGKTPQGPLRCAAKIRYRQADQACCVDAIEGGYRIRFDSPQRAVTPGQSVVLYDGERCLGGGVIEGGRVTQRTRLEQQTIALAGVAQAARLVDQISRTGSYPLEFFGGVHPLPIQLRYSRR